MHLAGARRTKADDTTDDDLPSTSGRQFTDVASDSAHSNDPKVVLARGHISFLHMQHQFNLTYSYTSTDDPHAHV